MRDQKEVSFARQLCSKRRDSVKVSTVRIRALVVIVALIPIQRVLAGWMRKA